MSRTPRVRPLWSGLATAGVLLVAMVAVIVGGIPAGPHISLPWDNTMTLKVQLVDADGLAPHASVDIAGVKVGEVQSVTSKGNIAVATLDITPQNGGIHRDAQVLLRPHGLFGPKYIEITEGSSTAPVFHDGDTVSVDQSVQPVDLDQVLQALQAPEAQNLRTAIVELGKASAGQGDDVNHLLGAARTLTQTLQTPLQTLDGVSSNLNDMLVKNESFNSSFAQTPLDQLVASSDTTLAAFASNATQLGSLLDHADSTLTQLDSALTGEGTSIGQVIDLLGKPGGTIDKLDTFNNLLGLFAANLTGKEAAPGHKPSDVTTGIIDAIENIKSAFSSYDCSLPNSTPNGPCPEKNREYYLRVQVFNLGGTGDTANQLQQIECSLPIFGLPGKKIPCPNPSNPASYGSRPGAGAGTDYATLTRLIAT